MPEDSTEMRCCGSSTGPGAIRTQVDLALIVVRHMNDYPRGGGSRPHEHAHRGQADVSLTREPWPLGCQASHHLELT